MSPLSKILVSGFFTQKLKVLMKFRENKDLMRVMRPEKSRTAVEFGSNEEINVLT